MFDLAILQAFSEELLKEAALTKEEQRRKRHAYYMANRTKILRTNQMYRTKNRAQIQRKKKIYSRRVKQGSRRVRKRIKQGHSFTYGGYR